MIEIKRNLLSSLLLLLLPALSWGVPIQADFVRSTVSAIGGTAIDHTTGLYYERIGYQGERNFNVYNNYADFAAGNSSSLTFNTPTTYYGTYAAVRNGKLFGRSTRQTHDYGRWDLGTGLQDASTTYTAFNPLNGPRDLQLCWIYRHEHHRQRQQPVCYGARIGRQRLASQLNR